MPTSPPLNLTIGLVLSTTIHLSWQPPPSDQQNGIIQSYIVIVLEVDTNMTMVIQDIMQHSISLPSLHPYYTYQISVAAYTVGVGPFVTELVQTEQDGKLCCTTLLKTC